MTFIKDKVLLGAAAIDARDAFDPNERAKYMNASEADTCIRKQWYSKHQPELSEEQDWGYARRGKGIEEYMVNAMRAANVDIRNAGEANQIGVYSDEYKMSATPDGQIVDYTSDDRIRIIGWEGKSMDPRTNRDYLPKPEHVTQLQIGMRLANDLKSDLGLPEDGEFSHGILSYTDASNWNDIIEFEVPYDPKILDRLKKRASRILNTKQVARLPREGKANGGKECDQRCSFKALCMGDSAPKAGTTKTGRGNAGSSLDTAVKRFVFLKGKVDELTAEQKQYAEEIKEGLRARKVGTLNVAGKEVTLAAVAGRKSLDRKAVTAAGIDLSPFEKVGAPSERLTVK